MKRIILVRHGETDWNREGRFQGQTDTELNEEGRAQARLLCARMAGRGIDLVASSDLRRARETAEILAASLTLDVAIDRDLRERSYGCFEGLTGRECAVQFPEAWARSDAPGAEPRIEVGERMQRALERLLRREGSTILAVSHGGAMRTFLERVSGEHIAPIANLGVYELEWDGLDFGAPISW